MQTAQASMQCKWARGDKDFNLLIAILGAFVARAGRRCCLALSIPVNELLSA